MNEVQQICEFELIFFLSLFLEEAVLILIQVALAGIGIFVVLIRVHCAKNQVSF